MTIDIDEKTYDLDLIAIALRYAAGDEDDPAVRTALVTAAGLLESVAPTK